MLFVLFYFHFRDIDKQHWRHLVTSLLTQLSSYSGPRCDILSRLYSKHDDGAQQPSDDTLTCRLKEMLALPDQRPIYLIIDALDECSNLTGIPSHRNRVLRLVKELVECLFTIKADKRRISRTTLDQLFIRIWSQSCGDGGRRIRNS